MLVELEEVKKVIKANLLFRPSPEYIPCCNFIIELLTGHFEGHEIGERLKEKDRGKNGGT
jgi:hypothetical protein